MPNNALSWQNDPSDYLQDAIGAPVTITSGLRTPQHNALVGGVPNSDHLRGQAYDFVPNGMSMADAASRLAASGIPVSKILNEGNHIHVSYPSQGQMEQTQGISDDDLLAALTGKGSSSGNKVATPIAPAGLDYPAGDSRNSPAAVTVAQPPHQISDDQLLAALTGGSQSKSTATPPPAVQQSPKAPSYIAAKPFTMGDEVMAHIPFAKDAVAGGTALLDTGANMLSGKTGPSLGQAYQQNMGALQQQQAQYEAANPTLSNVASGLGLVASGGPTNALAGTIRQSIPQLMSAGAKAGGTLGAIFGAGTPDQTNSLAGRAENIVGGGLGGAAVGGALPAAMAPVAAAGRLAGKAANKLFPSADNVAADKAREIINIFAGGPVSPNPNQIIPGSEPTMAESVTNPGVSVLQKQVTQMNANSPLLARQGQNSAARASYLEQAAGTPNDIESLSKARDKAATSDLKQVFSNPAAVADTTPVKTTIADIMSGPSGARPAVKAAMSDVSEILDNGGKPITHPETLYHSARKGIDDLIDGKDLTKQYGKAAASQLLTVRDALDDAIEKSAPGFKQYLSDYASSSDPITSMKFLQGLNLTDTKGNITLSKVQGALRNLEAQKAAPGIKGGKAVTDAQHDALIAIRDDLLRASKLDDGKARGSDTAQNLIQQANLGLAGPQKPSFIQRVAPELGTAGLGGALGYALGGPEGATWGAGIGDRLGAAIGHWKNERAAQSTDLLKGHLENMLLNPSSYSAPNTPSVVPTLNQIMNNSKTRTGMALANRLAILHQLGARQTANSP